MTGCTATLETLIIGNMKGPAALERPGPRPPLIGAMMSKILTRADQLDIMVDAALVQPIDVCLIWPHAIDTSGYPYLKVDGKTHRGHRIACERAHGPAPEGKPYALHSCVDQRDCVNPGHLRWGDHDENMQDKVDAGRQVRGEDQPNSVLTEKQVLRIRHLEGHVSKRDIAEMFGVTKQNIVAIWKRKSWKHL